MQHTEGIDKINGIICEWQFVNRSDVKLTIRNTVQLASRYLERISTRIDAVEPVQSRGNQFGPSTTATADVYSDRMRRERFPTKNAKIPVEKAPEFIRCERCLIELLPFAPETGYRACVQIPAHPIS